MPLASWVMSDEDRISATSSGTSAVHASLSVGHRDYYSTHVLFAAHLAAWEAEVREKHLAESEPRFDPRHRGAVIAAVVMVAAFLEAAINEVLQDAADDHITPKIANVAAETRGLWSAYWMGLDGGRRGDVLEKYQATLRLAGCDHFDEGADPYQSVRLLLRARNLLLHFKPETRWSDGPQNRLVNGLRSRVPRNPQVAGDEAPTTIEGLLSAGCARWAVEAADAFTQAFAERTGTQLNYQAVLPTFLAGEPDLPQL